MRRTILNIGVSLLAMAAANAAFAAAEPPTEGAFTIVVLPDTQNYADVNQPRLNHYFKTQTQWIVDNRDKHDIRYVFTLGDIVQHNREDEWPIARAAYDVLQEAGVPYSITGGNHDYGPNGNGSNWDTLLNDDRFFGPNSPYAQQPQIGGFLGEPGKTDSSWHTFEAGGKKWMIISTEWAPRDFVLDAANEVIKAHPDHNVVITTHAHLFNSSARYNARLGSQNWNPHNYGVGNQPEKPNDGQEIWEKVLKANPNVKLIMNGHVLNDGTGYLRSIGADGHIVNEYLNNFQMKADGGQSWLTLLEFHPDGETVRVRSYNPHLDTYNLQADHEFSLVITDKKVGVDHEQHVAEMKPRLYYRLMTEDTVQRPWGQAVVNAGTLGPVADAVFTGSDARAYRFDGSNSLSVRGGLSPMRSWTVAGWVRATEAATGQKLIELRSGQGAGLQIDLQPGDIDADNAYWTVSFGAGASTRTKIQDSRALNPNNWYHLVATYADGAMRFYVDGMLVEEQAELGNGLSLGMTRPVVGEGLTGEVGEIAVFDRALGFGEVNQLHLSAFNRVIAGNMLNDNPTISGNGAAPVTVVEQSFPGISVTQTNRGDHELFLGNALQSAPHTTPTLGRPALAGDGVMLTSVRQNNRDGLPISAEVGWNSFSDGVLSLATADVGNTIPNSPKENNVNAALAWFAYADGWTAGHVNRDGRLINGSGGLTEDMFIGLPLGEPGRFIADFGVNTRNDGLLFTVGANNSYNLTAATPREDGSAWDIRVVNNTNGAGVRGDFSFLYLRSDTEGLIGGSFDGVGGASTKSFGTFTATRLDTGLYQVTVPNETPETGMLILGAPDVAKIVALSYEADEEGNFIVQAIDPATAQRTDAAFNWAFVSFEKPIEFKGDDNLGEPNIVMPDDQILPPIDPLDFATACLDSYTPREDRNSIYASTDNGAGVAITGNGWKRLLGNYTITPDTMLSFEFSSRAEGEVSGIGFDTQDFMTANLSFKVYGTQSWGNQTFDNYSGNGAWQSYEIPVGQFYTGEFTRLFFVNDQDAAPVEINEANFRNIKIYQAGQPAPAQPIMFDRCDIKSHGGNDQDFAEYEVLDGGLELKIDGNGRKRADVDYLITPNTVLEFEFRSELATEGEVHAIGLDNNNVEGDSNNRIFMLFGVQDDFAIQDFNDYEGDGQWKSYRIPVGQYYTGLTRNVFFMSDDDRPGTSPASSSWRNVRVYEGNAAMN